MPGRIMHRDENIPDGQVAGGGENAVHRAHAVRRRDQLCTGDRPFTGDTQVGGEPGEPGGRGHRPAAPAGAFSSIESRTSTAHFELDTQPKMPPCALIIFSPTSWNSGKYEPTQSARTTHS
jgi:hypothetical protein